MESKENILNDCRRIFRDIRDRSNALKDVFEDSEKFDMSLRILHGQYSKLELYMFDLEQMESENVNNRSKN